MRNVFMIVCFLAICGQKLSSQTVDADLLKIKRRMDAIEQFTANMKLELDISFINMPTKYAVMTYVKGEPAKFSSDDFVMIPKRGLDFTLNKIFEYPFITVDRGTETKNGKLSADCAMMTTRFMVRNGVQSWLCSIHGMIN